MNKDPETPRALPAPSSGIHRRLFLDMAVLVLVISAAILAVTLTLGYRVTSRISSSLIETAAQGAQKNIDNYFDTVEKNLVVARKWGQSGILEMSNEPSMNAKFIPILEEMPQIRAVMLARSDGMEYLLYREGEDWLTRTTTMKDGPGEGLWQRWNRSEKRLDSWTKTSGYDPRKRTWYQGALDLEGSGKVFWTHPYLFFSSKKPGITASAAWTPADGPDTTYVIGYDVLLDDIYNLVAGLQVSKHGSAFLFTANGSVFTPEREQAPGQDLSRGGSYLTPAKEIGVPSVSRALARWQQDGKLQNKPVEYLVDGKRWWAGFSPLSSETGGLWLGMVIPEEDLLGDERKSRYVAALLLAVILGAGILVAVLLVRKYSHNLRDLPRRSLDREDPENALLSLIREGEGSTVEFKSTMRTDLKTGKPEKGIEQAWLKTVAAFLNTDGGTLLIGVDDGGGIRGIEDDSFASEDKCRLHFKNLISQHIGIEHSGSIHFEIHSVEGQKVILVECERSGKPVFLSHRSEESFYIRSGPASVKLSVSKALQYLETRK